MNSDLPDTPQGAEAARLAAQCLVDGASQGDAALAEAKVHVLRIARDADSPAFPEMLLGNVALLGLARHGSRASSYQEAENCARLALRRTLPELFEHSCVFDSGSA
jgi:hypothetical protein